MWESSIANKSRLCLPIVFEGAMKVEVLRSEVREDGAIKGAAMNPMGNERVGADFQDDDLNASVPHAGQASLNDSGVRGRIGRAVRIGPVPPIHRDGRHVTDFETG